MKKLISIVLTTIVLATGALAGASAAQPFERYDHRGHFDHARYDHRRWRHHRRQLVCFYRHHHRICRWR